MGLESASPLNIMILGLASFLPPRAGGDDLLGSEEEGPQGMWPPPSQGEDVSSAPWVQAGPWPTAQSEGSILQARGAWAGACGPWAAFPPLPVFISQAGACLPPNSLPSHQTFPQCLLTLSLRQCAPLCTPAKGPVSLLVLSRVWDPILCPRRGWLDDTAWWPGIRFPDQGQGPGCLPPSCPTTAPAPHPHLLPPALQAAAPP